MYRGIEEAKEDMEPDIALLNGVLDQPGAPNTKPLFMAWRCYRLLSMSTEVETGALGLGTDSC